MTIENDVEEKQLSMFPEIVDHQTVLITFNRRCNRCRHHWQAKAYHKSGLSRDCPNCGSSDVYTY